MFAIFALFACGEPAHDHASHDAKPDAAAHGQAGGPDNDPATHDHAAHDHDHAAGDGDHAHHAGGSDHMAAMARTREQLRVELGAAYDQPVAGLDAADATRGKALYDQHCASCHGADGKGDGPAAAGLNPPPADFTDAFHSRFYSDAGRVRIIQRGSPGTAMSGFEGTIDAQGILDVYRHVESLR